MFYGGPVAFVIVVVTVLNSLICCKVYAVQKASRKYAARKSMELTRRVFWQSLFYVAAFLVTMPFVLLSYYIKFAAGGSSFWIFAVASVLAPAQGMINALIYFQRSRGFSAEMFAYVKGKFTSQIAGVIRRGSAAFSRSWSFRSGESRDAHHPPPTATIDTAKGEIVGSIFLEDDHCISIEKRSSVHSGLDDKDDPLRELSEFEESQIQSAASLLSPLPQQPLQQYLDPNVTIVELRDAPLPKNSRNNNNNNNNDNNNDDGGERLDEETATTLLGDNCMEQFAGTLEFWQLNNLEEDRHSSVEPPDGMSLRSSIRSTGSTGAGRRTRSLRRATSTHSSGSDEKGGLLPFHISRLPHNLLASIRAISNSFGDNSGGPDRGGGGGGGGGGGKKTKKRVPLPNIFFGKDTTNNNNNSNNISPSLHQEDEMGRGERAPNDGYRVRHDDDAPVWNNSTRSISIEMLFPELQDSFSNVQDPSDATQHVAQDNAGPISDNRVVA